MAAITPNWTCCACGSPVGRAVAALRRTDLTVPWDQVSQRRSGRGSVPAGPRASRTRTRDAVANQDRHLARPRAQDLRGHPARTRPGLRIILRDSAYDEILLSVAEPEPLPRQMTARLDIRASRDGRASCTAGEPAPTGAADAGVVTSAGITLAGTVLLPPAGRPVLAAAVVITGSGPLDRDASDPRAPIGVGRELAEHLAAAGIASLRYDKRGVARIGRLPTWPQACTTTSTMPGRPSESLAAQPECDRGAADRSSSGTARAH